MEHEFHSVDILNEAGDIIGQKPRREINKLKDIHHSVFTLVITPDSEMVLALIPAREDLPNLYPSQYGATMATIRRHNETARQAAIRGISRELFIDDAEPELLGEGMETLADGRKIFASFFTITSVIPDTFSLIDITKLEAMKRSKFEALLDVKPERVAPTMQLLWEKYNQKLGM